MNNSDEYTAYFGVCEERDKNGVIVDAYCVMRISPWPRREYSYGTYGGRTERLIQFDSLGEAEDYVAELQGKFLYLWVARTFLGYVYLSRRSLKPIKVKNRVVSFVRDDNSMCIISDDSGGEFFSFVPLVEASIRVAIRPDSKGIECADGLYSVGVDYVLRGASMDKDGFSCYTKSLLMGYKDKGYVDHSKFLPFNNAFLWGYRGAKRDCVAQK